MKNKKLTAWQKATNELAQEFCTKYFETNDWSWVGCPEEIGGILEVNGYYFGLDRIVDAIEINCSRELLIQFYEYEMDCLNDKSLPRYNFKTWVKYYAGFKNTNTIKK
jgi:hypothetical protein